jgi:hypothetical protein
VGGNSRTTGLQPRPNPRGWSCPARPRLDPPGVGWPLVGPSSARPRLDPPGVGWPLVGPSSARPGPAPARPPRGVGAGNGPRRPRCPSDWRPRPPCYVGTMSNRVPVTTFRLNLDVVDQLTQVSQAMGLTRTEAIAIGVLRFLNNPPTDVEVRDMRVVLSKRRLGT